MSRKRWQVRTALGMSLANRQRVGGEGRRVLLRVGGTRADRSGERGTRRKKGTTAGPSLFRQPDSEAVSDLDETGPDGRFLVAQAPVPANDDTRAGSIPLWNTSCSVIQARDKGGSSMGAVDDESSLVASSVRDKP